MFRPLYIHHQTPLWRPQVHRLRHLVSVGVQDTEIADRVQRRRVPHVQHCFVCSLLELVADRLEYPAQLLRGLHSLGFEILMVALPQGYALFHLIAADLRNRKLLLAVELHSSLYMAACIVFS